VSNTTINGLSGNSNTAYGAGALQANTTGQANTAYGAFTLPSSTTSFNNTALGFNAGSSISTANNVIAIGSSGVNVSDSCFIGNIRGTTTSQANAVPVVIDSFGQLGTMSSSRRFKNEIKPMDQTSEAS
jgi:hypothetical protein